MEEYGFVRSEQVVLLFLDMVGSSKLRPLVLDWFMLRRDYAAPIVREAERVKGPLQAASRKVLAHLDSALSTAGAVAIDGAGAAAPTAKRAAAKKAAPKKAPAKKTASKKAAAKKGKRR